MDGHVHKLVNALILVLELVLVLVQVLIHLPIHVHVHRHKLIHVNSYTYSSYSYMLSYKDWYRYKNVKNYSYNDIWQSKTEVTFSVPWKGKY